LGDRYSHHAGGTFFLVAYNGAGATASLTVAPGGTVIHDGASQALSVTWASSNVSGMVNLVGGTISTTTKGFNFGSGAPTGTQGFVNFDAGTYSTGAAITNG